MSRTKHKQLKRAVPVAGAVGVSVALAGGAAAGTVGTTTDVKDTAQAPEINFSDEEIADVRLGTFFVFDKEDVARPGVQYAQGCRRCGGCRGCGLGCRACRACGGCSGCACNCCVSWGACRWLC
jgi:hypothetical protein